MSLGSPSKESCTKAILKASPISNNQSINSNGNGIAMVRSPAIAIPTNQTEEKPKKLPQRKPMTSINAANSKKTNRSELPSSKSALVKPARSGKIITTKPFSMPAVNKIRCLERQYTLTMMKYRYRKSISQMDLKQARRSGLTPFATTTTIAIRSKAGRASIPLTETQMATAQIAERLSICKDLKIAGMRVYGTIMLNAWRKRRSEIKALKDEVEELKRNSVKVKNQLHVFNTLFRTEKQRNEELSEKLKSAQDIIAVLKDSEMGLKNKLTNCETQKVGVSQQLQIKTQDYHALNVFFKQTKSELFKVMSELHQAQSKLEVEQSKAQQLEAEKVELIKNVDFMCQQTEYVEKQLLDSLKAKDASLQLIQAELKSLQAEYASVKENSGTQLRNLMESEAKLRNELENLQSEVKVIRRCLAATLGQRVRNCWNNSILVQRASCQVVHWFTASLLPATPAPRVVPLLPFSFNLEKAMSIMKR